MLGKNRAVVQGIIFHCQVHADEEEQLVHVCIEPTCKRQPYFVCVRCMAQQHTGHQTIAFNKFRSEIDNTCFDTSVEIQVQKAKDQVKRLKVDFVGKLEQLKNTIEKILKEAETPVKQDNLNQVSARLDIILAQYNSHTLNYIQVKQGKSQQEIYLDIKQQRDNFLRKKQFKDNLNKEFSAFFQSFQNQLAESLLNAMTKSVKSFQIFEKQIGVSRYGQKLSILFEDRSTKFGSSSPPVNSKQLIRIKTPPPLENKHQRALKWDFKLKHNDISIEDHGRLLTRQRKTTNANVCGLAYEQISKFTAYSWSFRIHSLHQNIFLGICDPKFVSSKEYAMCSWSDLGHSHYCISSFGRQFSSSNRALNFKDTEFRFVVGDTLKFDYLSSHNTLLITKNNLQTIQFDVVPGFYRPVAYLGSAGDKVEIVN